MLPHRIHAGSSTRACTLSRTPLHTHTRVRQHKHINTCTRHQGAKEVSVGGHPCNLIMLTCDAFGVLPPVAKLSPEQAMYHFISGYTAKVAGTEEGVEEPQATFSACFGAPFLVWHPNKYAELLAEKMQRHQTNCYLVNTGWSGGGHGVGKRMSLKHTRAVIDAIHSGELETAQSETDPVFGTLYSERRVTRLGEHNVTF